MLSLNMIFLLSVIVSTKKIFQKSKKNKSHQGSVNLKRIDNKPIFQEEDEIRLFAILRNEALRLPHFIEYYTQLGVNKFFFIDNNSTDNSADIILEEKEAYLFFTNDSYVNHWNWMEHLLETYGKNHWCVVVDIDELFSYANAETVNLHMLTKYLDKYSYTSVNTLLLDMYGDFPIEKNQYTPSKNPIDYMPFFDSDYYKTPFVFRDKKNNNDILIEGYSGGMRERVFGKMSPLDILTKVPLFKYSAQVYLVQGMHAITGTLPADIEGVVFHTKFLNDFIAEVEEEAEREEHYNNAIRYKHYLKTIRNKGDINLYSETSIKYKNTNQLVSLGLMKSSYKYDGFIKNLNE